MVTDKILPGSVLDEAMITMDHGSTAGVGTVIDKNVGYLDYNSMYICRTYQTLYLK